MGQVKEVTRQMWAGASVARLLAELRYALRALRRTPGFTVTVVLILGLGIGLGTAVFTVADALLIRRLPVQDQNRLVVLWSRMPKAGFDHWPLKLSEAREFARDSRTLEHAAFVAYEGAWPKPVMMGGQITRFTRAVVSAAFFEELGTGAFLGRAHRPRDDVPGAAPVLVLSYSAWRQRFGGDPHVLGRHLLVYDDGVTYTVVGVMPRGLDYPRGAEMWVPLVPARDTSASFVDVIGRLAPGETPASARGELSAFARAEARPGRPEVLGVVHTLPRLILGEVRPAVLVLAAAAALLLLITCINVANLLFVRGLARVREVAVRSALGAARGRIVQQLLVENAVLAVAGGALGVAVAALAVRGFVLLAPPDLPYLGEIHLDAAALLGAITITGLALLLFGLAPAVMTSRIELQQALRSGTRQSAGRASRRLTEVLVAAQVALALLVLSAAGLIARSLVNLDSANLALQPSHLLVADLALEFKQFDTVAKQTALMEDMVRHLQATPGVLGASPVNAVPYSGSGGWDGRPSLVGQTPEEAARDPMLNMEVVTPSYFSTLGLSVIRGRGFTDDDRHGAPPVVVLSQRAARDYWPSENPLGKQLRVPGGTASVIGIVPETRYRDLRDARPSIYLPLAQSPFPYAPMTLVIRTSGPPARTVPAIRRVIGETAPGVALASAQPFEAFRDRQLAEPQLEAVLLALFAGAAVALAAIGLFGVMMTMVRQRSRELGIRMVLGATGQDLRDMVLRRGLVIAASGGAVGLVAAIGSSRLLVALLYEVSPTDAPTLAAVSGILLGVAALATLIPARSSTRTDPVVALRADE